MMRKEKCWCSELRERVCVREVRPMCHEERGGVGEGAEREK
jgi:hypothetical protein